MKILLERDYYKEEPLDEQIFDIKIPLDTTIIIDEYVDMTSEDWAKPKIGNFWEPEDNHIKLCDYQEAIDYTLDVLFSDKYDFPDEPGSYKVKGIVNLVFVVDGLYETRESYKEYDPGSEDGYYWDTYTSINDDYAEVRFDEYSSRIDDLVITKLGKGTIKYEN